MLLFSLFEVYVVVLPCCCLCFALISNRNAKKKKKGAPGSGQPAEKEKDKKGTVAGVKAEAKTSQDRIKSQDGKQRGHEDSDHKLDKGKSAIDRPESHMTGERTDSAEDK